MRSIGWYVLALALAAVACGTRSGGGDRPAVAVSIFPLYDITRRIAGDRVDVILVLPPGRSEHGYDPTPKEIARIGRAKLGIAVGLDMDRWVEDIMRNAGGARVVRLGEKVKTIPIELEPIGAEEAHGEHRAHDDHDHDHDDHDDHDHHDHRVGAPDPHFWLDPVRMAEVVNTIRDELTALDPAGKAELAARAETVQASLRELDAAIAARSKRWTKRTIVTFHGSMGYYARRYGLRIAATVEPVPGKEPTAAYLAEVIAAIRRTRAAALFTEPQLDRGPGETIAREAGIPLGELDPIGGVAGRDTYEALLTYNTDQLAKLLE